MIFNQIQERIIDQFTFGISPAKNPVVVILGGQPGAGKTELERLASAELGGNVISCNADVFRDYHPYAEKIKAAHESYYPEVTAAYAQRWNNGLRAYCEANRLSYILETTFSSGSGMNKTISDLRDKGYRVEIKLLAVHPKLSLLGTHFRFEHMKLKENTGRIVGKHAHDSRYHMIAPTLYLVQADNLYHILQLYCRTVVREGQSFNEGLQLLATNAKNAVQIFQKEADKKWSADLRTYFKKGVENVLKLKYDRNATATEINTFREDMDFTYPTQLELQEEFKQQVYKQQQAILVDKRLSGKLPLIDIAGVEFTIDWRLKELRETNNPTNNLRFSDMELGEDGKTYACFYDIKKHAIVHPALDIKELPKNLKVLEIPGALKLDPVAMARDSGVDVHSFIAVNPIEKNLSATLHPLSYSNLPELVRQNKTRTDHEESLKKGKDRSNGISR